MAKEAKTEKIEKTETKTTKKAKASTNWSNLSLKELKAESDKLAMDIKLGKENNTSLSKKLKKHIAKELTKLNNTKN